MTEEEKKSIKQKIIADVMVWKEHIEALEFSIRQIPPDQTLDRAVRMEVINHKRRCEADIRTAMAKVSRLEVALKRIGAPGFGICIECEKPIPTERLMRLPETLWCESCGED